jgi:hypothetical protein
VAVGRERDGCRLGAVPARNEDDASAAVVGDHLPVLDRRRGWRKHQLGVASEPQHRPPQTAAVEHRFRPALLPGDRAGRIFRHGVDDRREDDVADPGSGRGVDGGAMLADAATDGIGTDEEHPVAAGKGVGQRGRLVEVAVADVGPASAQLAQGVRTASDEDELLGREALQQLLGHEAAKVSRCSCDDDAHRPSTYGPGSASGPSRSDGAYRTRGQPDSGDSHR